MADLMKLVKRVSYEATSAFASHSGTVYVEILESEDKGFGHWRIYAASPTEAHFNAAPVGSWLIDTDAPATFKIHTSTTAWVTVTTS